MIVLGNKICLRGFERLGQAEILIVKKMIGSYVRQACDDAGCSYATITLEREETGFTVKVRAQLENDSEKTSEASGTNVFVTLDEAMKQLLANILPQR